MTIRKIKNQLLIIIISIVQLNAQTPTNTNSSSLFIANRWLTECLDLTKNCVGYSAPVSARSLAYMSVGLYECGVENQTKYISLSNQLNGYQRTTRKQEKDKIYWPYVYNNFSYKLATHLYSNMPASNLSKVVALKDSINLSYKKIISKKEINNSETYVDNLFKEFLAWMVIDGGNAGYNKNFPTSYKPEKCASCWETTVPGYLNALQPYWGKNRLMLSANERITNTMIAPVFSTDTTSAFYKDALKLYLDHNLKLKSSEIIAEYWDDAAGYSATPTGHQFLIAMQLAHAHQFDLGKTLHLYAALGLSINDAFIVCWKGKYQFNLIRPITYIQRYISQHFNTLIPTPPFPEFPSGHSMQSGAAGEIFKSFISDTVKIVDYSNQNRVDIYGKPREFKNISSMVSEISISRFYGGIHYMNTLNLSVDYGKKIGQNIISNLIFLKND